MSNLSKRKRRKSLSKIRIFSIMKGVKGTITAFIDSNTEVYNKKLTVELNSGFAESADSEDANSSVQN